MKQILALSLMFVLVGCGPTLTLQPLWDEQHLVAEPRLEGRWISTDGDAILRFRPAENKQYKVDFISDDGASRYDGHLVRLGEHLFLDLCLSEKSGAALIEGQAFAPLVAVHFFARLRFEADKLHLGLFDDEDMKEQIEAGVVKLRSAKADGGLLLTGDTRELQEAVAALAGAADWEETAFSRAGSN